MRFRRRKRIEDQEVLDLREAADRTDVGRPGACPRCGGHGYLDSIDVRTGTQHQHCLRCEHAWTYTIDVGARSRRTT